MWSTFSYNRWIFLLSLALVMLLSESEVKSLRTNIVLPCCDNLTKRRPANITKCYEQKPRRDCNIHAFVMFDHNNKKFCVKYSKRLNDKLEKEQIKCPLDISLSH